MCTYTAFGTPIAPLGSAVTCKPTVAGGSVVEQDSVEPSLLSRPAGFTLVTT